jgi:hypothetical protein
MGKVKYSRKKIVGKKKNNTLKKKELKKQKGKKLKNNKKIKMNKKLNKVKRKYSLKVKKQKGGGDFYQTVSKLDGIFITKRRNDNCPEGLDEKTVGTKKICFIRKNDEVQRNDERMDKEKSLIEVPPQQVTAIPVVQGRLDEVIFPKLLNEYTPEILDKEASKLSEQVVMVMRENQSRLSPYHKKLLKTYDEKKNK